MARAANDIIGTLWRTDDFHETWKIVGDDGRERILRPNDVLYIPSVRRKGAEEPCIWTYVVNDEYPTRYRLWHRTEEYGEVSIVPWQGMHARCI